MKLAASQIAWSAGEENEALALLRALGFAGLEIAPPRVAGPQPYERPAEAAVFTGRMRDEYGLGLCSMQSIWFGQAGNLFGAERAFLLDYTKSAMRFAKAAGIPNLVFGCPKNRNRPEGAPESEAESFFRELSAYAAAQGCCLALEANPAIYGTNLMNTTAEALEMAKRVASPGCRVNLDVGTMIANGENPDLLRGRVAEIHHVHISEPNLLPIERRPLHRALAALLREEDYAGYVSLEMREQPLAVVEQALHYLREVFA